MIKSSILLVIFLSLGISFAQGEITWSEDIRVTKNTTQDFTISGGRIVYIEKNGRVHVVWGNVPSSGFSDIYYIRSQEDGITFGSPVCLTQDKTFSAVPAITGDDNGYIHIAWIDESKDGYSQIYYKYSPDNGNTWSSDIQIANVPLIEAAIDQVGECNITVDPNNYNKIYIVWGDPRHGSDEVYLRKSTDRGKTWDREIRVTNIRAGYYWGYTYSDELFYTFEKYTVGIHPQILVNPNDSRNILIGCVILTSEKDINTGGFLLMASTDGGTTWKTSIHFMLPRTGDSGPTGIVNFSMTMDKSGYLHLALVSSPSRHGIPMSNIFYYKFDLASTQLVSTKQLVYGEVTFKCTPSISVDESGNVHAVWEQPLIGSENSYIYYAYSANGGIDWEKEKITKVNNSGLGLYMVLPSLPARIFEVVALVWSDYRDGNLEIYYKRGEMDYIGPDVQLTSYGSDGYPSLSQQSIDVDPSNRVHVAWTWKREGQDYIYYRRSTDGGNTWSESPQKLHTSASNTGLGNPHIASGGDYVNIYFREAGYDDQNSNGIFQKRGRLGGSDWYSSSRIIDDYYYDDPNSSYEEDIENYLGAVDMDDNENVHLMWELNWDEGKAGEDRKYGQAIGYGKSSNWGGTWSLDKDFVGGYGIEDEYYYNPWVSTDGYGNVYMLYWNYNYDQILFRRSTDNGKNWSNSYTLVNYVGAGNIYPKIVSSEGGGVMVIWTEYDNYNDVTSIKYIGSRNFGASWTEMGTIFSPDYYIDYEVSLAAIGGGKYYVVFPSAYGELYLGILTDYGGKKEVRKLTESSRYIYNTSIAVDKDGYGHVVWEDSRNNGEDEVFYKKFKVGGSSTQATAMSITQGGTQVASTSPLLPKRLSLKTYPNPMKNSTTIVYELPKATSVSLSIYNAAGQLVRNLINGQVDPGRYTLRWDGKDAKGRKLRNGVYFYRLETGNKTLTKKLLVIK